MNNINDQSKNEVKNMQPLVLAFIGDGVHTLFIREQMVKKGDYKVNELNRMVKEKVCYNLPTLLLFVFICLFLCVYLSERSDDTCIRQAHALMQI